MLRYLLLLPIKLYWLIIPPSKRNKCLFKESCSNHIFKITRNEGLQAGFKTLIHRFKNCRPGYQVIDIKDETFIISANHEMFPITEMRDFIFK